LAGLCVADHGARAQPDHRHLGTSRMSGIDGEGLAKGAGAMVIRKRFPLALRINELSAVNRRAVIKAVDPLLRIQGDAQGAVKVALDMERLPMDGRVELTAQHHCPKSQGEP